MSAQGAAMVGRLVVVPGDGDEQPVTLARSQPRELRPGPGFAIYERRRDARGVDVDELITIVAGPEPTLCAVGDEQLNAWKNKRLFARPMRLEAR
jgi:hypothetical protein